MANRDIVLTIIVLLGIGWLLLENYHRAPQPQPAKPTIVQPTQPATK